MAGDTRARVAWRNARERAERHRERWIGAETVVAQLRTGPQVPLALLCDVQVLADRHEDTLMRVANLIEVWGETDEPISRRQARQELISAVNRRDGRDIRVARLRGRVRELERGLAEVGRRSEIDRAERGTAEAQLARVTAVLGRVADAPVVRPEVDGVEYVSAAELRARLSRGADLR
ncbi:hypothetical protein [Kitasatospora sp. NPDC088548]|uniref:hypothetical protein n=1 Tax=Kitasatospora sp. NPDC088548 TaxID=3364075 RepID=UPI00380CA551